MQAVQALPGALYKPSEALVILPVKGKAARLVKEQKNKNPYLYSEV